MRITTVGWVSGITIIGISAAFPPIARRNTGLGVIHSLRIRIRSMVRRVIQHLTGQNTHVRVYLSRFVTTYHRS